MSLEASKPGMFMRPAKSSLSSTMVVLVVQDLTDIVLGSGSGSGVLGFLTGGWLYYASGMFEKKDFNFLMAHDSGQSKNTLVVVCANYQTIFQGNRGKGEAFAQT